MDGATAISALLADRAIDLGHAVSVNDIIGSLRAETWQQPQKADREVIRHAIETALDREVYAVHFMEADQALISVDDSLWGRYRFSARNRCSITYHDLQLRFPELHDRLEQITDDIVETVEDPLMARCIDNKLFEVAMDTFGQTVSVTVFNYLALLLLDQHRNAEAVATLLAVLPRYPFMTWKKHTQDIVVLRFP